MKKKYFTGFKVPIIDLDINIWVGDIEGYDKHCKKLGAHYVNDDPAANVADSDGYHYKNCLYFSERLDPDTIIHETIHLIDWIEKSYCPGGKEEEFNAYIGAYIFSGIFELLKLKIVKK